MWTEVKAEAEVIVFAGGEACLPLNLAESVPHYIFSFRITVFTPPLSLSIGCHLTYYHIHHTLALQNAAIDAQRSTVRVHYLRAGFTATHFLEDV